MIAPLIDHDRIAEVYEGTVGSREFQQVSRRRLHWMCAQVTGDDVVDVGCSQGIASILLGREGRRVVGIDREHEAIRAARERLDQEEPEVRDRVEFRIGEARALPYPDESFDAVLLGEILEHQLDPARPLDEARRVLRPGGRIVITTPYGIHPYPDHKDPLYLSALLEQLEPKLSIASITLVDRYLGLVAELSKDRVPRVWRRALGVAEHRLADQDEALESLRGLVGELREGARALERSRQDQDLTTKAVEIQRDAATQRQAELQTRLAEVEEKAAAAAAGRDGALRDLEEARERLSVVERERTAAADRAHQLEAEERAAARELERMHSEVRGVRERLHRIELGHRSATADLERAQAERDAARAELERAQAGRDAARAELEAARRELAERAAAAERDLAERAAAVEARSAEAERAHAERAAAAEHRLAERTALLEAQLAERDAALAEALRESERVQAATALEAERIRADTARVVEISEEERTEALAQVERLESQAAASRTRLAEARTRMAELIADRDAARDASVVAAGRADQAEVRLARLEEEATALRTQAEGLRSTVEALTSEGAALRRALREVETGLEKERRQKQHLEGRLAAATKHSEELGQDLAAIQGRVGYRMGRFMRRLTFMRDPTS